MVPERKSIHERLECSLELAREAGFPDDRERLDEKSFMDDMWDEPSGNFSLTNVECIDLSKDLTHPGADDRRHLD